MALLTGELNPLSPHWRPRDQKHGQLLKGNILHFFYFPDSYGYWLPLNDNSETIDRNNGHWHGGCGVCVCISVFLCIVCLFLLSVYSVLDAPLLSTVSYWLLHLSYCIRPCQTNQHSAGTPHNRLVCLALLPLLCTTAALLRGSEWTLCLDMVSGTFCTKAFCAYFEMNFFVFMQVQCRYRGSVQSLPTKCPTTSSKCMFRISILYVLYEAHWWLSLVVIWYPLLSRTRRVPVWSCLVCYCTLMYPVTIRKQITIKPLREELY